MSYDLKSFYDSVDELTTRDRALSIMYGRIPDNEGGGIVPIAVDATGHIQIGTSITLEGDITVVQPDSSMLHATTNLAFVSGSSISLGSKTSANSLPVVLASDQGPLPIVVTPATSSSATLTNVVGSLTSTTILAANASRTMAALFNESANPNAILYLKFGAGASLTSYTVQIPAGSYYEFPAPIYTGAMSGIWSTSAAATARITEFT